MNATLDTAPPRYVETAPLGVGRAHAKAILFGEHAVVYGAPALAVPLPGLATTVYARRSGSTFIGSDLYTGAATDAPARLGPVVTAINSSLQTLRSRGVTTSGVDVHITSDVPPDRGLGSSAAVAAAIAEAVAAAYNVTFTPEERFDIAQEAERHAHGNPSGLDARTVLADGPIHFHEGLVRPIEIGTDLLFLLADSGVPGSTATAVSGVRAMHDTDLGTARRIIASLADLATRAEGWLREGDLTALGDGMTAAHEHLRSLGVSVPELNNLVAAARVSGALGAKLTGGGLGGCVLALVPDAPTAQRVASALRTAGASAVWKTRVPRS